MSEMIRKGDTPPSPGGITQRQVSTGGAGLSDGDYGDVVVGGSGTTMAFDSGVVTAAAKTVLDDATVAAMVDTLGGASSTGTGGLVRATSPTLVTPLLGTPTSGTLTNCTGLPTAGLVDGAVTPAKASTALKTHAKTIYIEGPTAADDFPICYVGDAVTIIAIRSVTDAGTVTFNIEQRGKFTPATAGTNVLSSDQVADTGGEEVTSSFADATVPADNWLCYAASAVASSPTKLWVCVEYTID